MMAFSSVMVTCLARSTACATCCWCWGSKAGSEVGPPAQEARGRGATQAGGAQSYRGVTVL